MMCSMREWALGISGEISPSSRRAAKRSAANGMIVRPWYTTRATIPSTNCAIALESEVNALPTAAASVLRRVVNDSDPRQDAAAGPG
jgi:hypothetical protein